MSSRTEDLLKAKQEKNDEFYTQYEDIQREINGYLEYNPDVFRDKTVLLPCDDPEWSNFTKFFAQNFENLGLKKLISTSFATNSKNKNSKGYQFSISDFLTDFEKESSDFDEEKSLNRGKLFTLTRRNKKVDINDLKWEYLEGDGDFRSEEVCKLRDEADIIVTNPPFSLFRPFVSWLLEGNKKFLIIGNIKAVTYKEIFPFIRANKIWTGLRFNERVNGKNMTFSVPDSYPLSGTELFIGKDGKKYISVPGTGWFTNIEHGRRHQPLSLMSKSDNIKFSKQVSIKNNKGYIKYDNYEGIDIPSTDSIPNDFKGVMGVPISFIKFYCPEQFVIVGTGTGDLAKEIGIQKNYRGRTDLALTENGKHRCPFQRILIRYSDEWIANHPEDFKEDNV